MIELAPPPIPRYVRVVIVGAGRAGLAMAYWLQRRGMKPQRDFVILDEGAGERKLDLEPATFTVRDAALPGIRPPGDPRRAMTVGELGDYLDAYESQLGLKPIWGVRITSIQVDPHGHGLHLVTDDGEIATRNVVVTGSQAIEGMPTGATSGGGQKPAAREKIPGLFELPTTRSGWVRSFRTDTARLARTIARRP